jgi:hypothetical protein
MNYFKKGGASTVVEEPLLPEADPLIAVRGTTTLVPGARADVAVASAKFAGGRDFYGDVAVLDTGAASYLDKHATTVLENHEKRKCDEYSDRVASYGTFVPLVCSIYGTLAPAAAEVAHRVARAVDADREERDAVLDLHSVVLQSAILKATSQCLRARAWNSQNLPPLRPSPSPLEDASGCLALVAAREEL